MSSTRLGIALLDGRLSMVNILDSHKVDSNTYYSAMSYDVNNLMDTKKYPSLIDSWQLLSIIPENFAMQEVVMNDDNIIYRVLCKECMRMGTVDDLNFFLDNDGIACLCSLDTD